MLKQKVSRIQDDWLEHDNNIDLWLGNSDKKLTAKKRRILITHWVGEAYSQLMTDEYSQSRWRSFEKTGCLITADGSEDSKIQPEGLKGYTVPPPLPVASSDQPMQSPIPEPNVVEQSDDLESDNQEILCMNYEEEKQDDKQEDEERIDLENDRTRKRPFKNRKLKILYDKWEIGKII